MKKQSNRVIPLRTTDTIRQEAADWLVKLDEGLDSGGLSDRELAALREWLAQSPEHSDILQSQAQIWSDMDIYATMPEELAPRTEPSLWSLLYSLKPVRIASVMACWLLIGLSVWWAAPLVDYDTNTFTTGIGSQRIERLADGSRAHLNTDTQIRVVYNDQTRAVWLTKGEALFDVVHDPDRPFIVYAQGRAVRAVGTKFVVRLTSEKILVTVTEGKVAFSKQPEKTAVRTRSTETASLPVQEQELVLLEEGQSAEVDVTEPQAPVLEETDDDELQRRFSWVNGRLTFDNETLDAIIHEISRYTPVKVVITDPEIKSYRLSGRFQLGDTEALLEAIEVSREDVRVDRNKDVIYIAKKAE